MNQAGSKNKRQAAKAGIQVHKNTVQTNFTQGTEAANAGLGNR